MTGIKTDSLVTNVQCLNTIPKWMFLHIEHYGLLRTLKNTSVGHSALKILFTSPNLPLYPRDEKITRGALIKNLFSVNREYDFSTYKYREFSSLPITKQTIEEILNITETMNADPSKAIGLLSNSFGKFSLFQPAEAPDKNIAQKNLVDDGEKLDVSFGSKC